eukprot:jgi/Botrbrau1/1567/Bobra.0107s0054.1
MQAARQVVQNILRHSKSVNQVRHMSGGLSQAEEEKQMKLWRTISILAVPACGVFALQSFSKPHEHHHESAAYPYLHIRAKEFPWGECALFDMDCWKEAKGAKE